MSPRREWINRLRYLGRRKQFEGSLDDEIEFHIEARAAELEASGLSRGDALTQARREFGPVARMREESRSAWQFGWLEDLAADLRYAFRAFRRSPGFTITAVLSLALGIGANSAVFTALDAIIWKPLPVADPYSLVKFSISRTNHGPTGVLPRDYINILRDSGAFDGLIRFVSDGLSFSYDDRAERIMGEAVAPDYFQFLGVQPALGQCFTPEVRAGHWAAEVVLSYRFWKRRFSGDPHVIGRTIRLNTYPFTIVGVSSSEFLSVSPGFDPELRVPILPDGRQLAQISIISGFDHDLWRTIARLKPGVTMAQAESIADAQLQELLRTSSLRQIQNAGYRHTRVLSCAQGLSSDLDTFHAPLFILFGLVAVVLLIACANVANMLLARAAARRRELAVRRSIGAGRGRLIRQMLAESVLLGLMGGTAGVWVAGWAVQVLFRFLPQGHISVVLDLHPDTRTLLFTFGLSLLTGIALGLVPAIHATRADLAATLKSDSAASVGEAGASFRKALVVGQVAFSLLLLIAAGVFVRTLSSLRPADYHANPNRVLLFTMKPQTEIYSDERKRALTAEMVRRISEIPGVKSAAFAENGPLGSRTSSDMVGLAGHDPIRADSDSVTPGFFDTVGISRISGRDFTAADMSDAPRVVIVNQSLARALFHDENPLGRNLVMMSGKESGSYEIVGVVADTHYYDIHADPRPGVWFAIQQLTPYMPTLHVRTAASDTAAIVAAVRNEFNVVDKGFPVFNIRTLEMRFEDSLARERMVADLSAAFGVLALLLAAVGLYGVIAYSVSRRTREIGIRMALGSSSGSVLWLISREAMLLVAAGSAAGIGISLLSTRLLKSYLFGVSVAGPATLFASTGAMLLIAAIAVSIPAARACRVDPLIALRHD